MAEIYFKDPKDYILLEYNLRKNRRPSYSMRAFARDLQFSASSLNDFLKGRVGMSQDRIEKLAQFLEWSSERKNHFTELITAYYDTNPSLRQSALMTVKRRMKDKSSYFSLQEFNTVSQWYHLVIVEICQLKDNISANNIAELLDITAAEARKALTNLIQLKILHDTKLGLKPVENTTQFGDEAPSDSIKSFHSQILQQAQKSIYEKPIEERENQSLIFSMPQSDRQAMTDEIKKALYDIVNKYAAKPKANSVQIVALNCFQAVGFDGK